MKNLKLKNKLILGFGIVLVMLLILSAVAFFNMNKIETQISKYEDYTIPNTNGVWQMRRDMVSVQRYQLMALTESDQAKIEEYLGQQESEMSRLQDTMVEYLKTTRADKDKIAQVQDNLDAMTPVSQEIAKLLIMNDGESNKKAYKIFEEQFKPVLDENATLLTEIGDYQVGLADAQAKEAETAFRAAIILMLLVIAAAVIVTIFVTIYITKMILVPVKEVQAASLAIVKGELDVEVVYESKDELGNLADNMRSTMGVLKTIIGDVDYLLTSMGDGNFDVQSTCTDQYTGQYLNLLSALRVINTNLSDTLSQINQASEQVSAGADQVSFGAQALSQGATEQASSVEELAATINDISGQVKMTAENAQSARNEGENAGMAVTESNQQMEEMIAAMKKISSKSEEISKIIKTIEDIAFQTNILALNAAVEAARAGAAGKGFAVVANEVRNLAGKSAEAAKNTTMLIEETVQAVQEGTKIADGTAQAMLNVVDGTRKVIEFVAQIADASNVQAQSLNQVTTGVDQISSVVQTNSATAEESAAASEELSGQAKLLKDLIDKFKLKSDSEKPTAAVAGSQPKKAVRSNPVPVKRVSHHSSDDMDYAKFTPTHSASSKY